MRRAARSYAGIDVARALLAGDYDRARRLAAGVFSWRVAEARAIAGAARVASLRFHPITFAELTGGKDS